MSKISFKNKFKNFIKNNSILEGKTLDLTLNLIA